MGIKLVGRHDTFEVYCSECNDSIDATPVVEPLLNGQEVECVSCGASGVAYDDGGIYKLVNDDEPLEIRVVE